MLFIFLRAADWYFSRMRIVGLKTGDYGNPPQFERWWRQTLVFSLGLVVMKIVVVIVLTWVRCHFPSLLSIRNLIEDADNEFLLLSCVILAIPLHFWRVGPRLDTQE